MDPQAPLQAPIFPGATDAQTSQAPAGTLAGELIAPSVTRAYQCQCGRPVFLRNSECLACHTPLGYVVDQLGVVPLAPVPADDPEPDTFTLFGLQGRRYRRCANLHTAAACNWMVPVRHEGDAPDCHAEGLIAGLCLSCSLTRTIPDLSIEANGPSWLKLEVAKRRLVSQLLALGLPVVTRNADPARGLAFDFLGSLPGGPRVMTGHDNGLITLNVDEAEDAVRERIRAEMREPYRTLVGHFRHEVGHYYWDQLVAPTPWLEDFRTLFGDEREDYGQALQRHYQDGPPPDWALRFVSTYASSHPWEDWAETWAHYLHMADTADTAKSFGLDARHVELSGDLFELQDLWQPDRPDAQAFLDFLNGWVQMTAVLNELSRSMGQPDFYPFVLPRAAVGKLQFVHELIADQRTRNGRLPEAVAQHGDSAGQVEPAPADAGGGGAPVPLEGSGDGAPVSPMPQIDEAPSVQAQMDQGGGSPDGAGSGNDHGNGASGSVAPAEQDAVLSHQQQQQPSTDDGAPLGHGGMPSAVIADGQSPKPSPLEQQFQQG